MNGCSVNELFLLNEINRVTIVKSTPEVKHYRAYFARSELKPVWKKQKYLFLYNRHKHDLGLVLRHHNTYTLYHFSHRNLPVVKLKITSRHRERHMLHSFAKIGYRTADLKALGYRTKVGLRRYKGVKTLMFDVKDYRRRPKEKEANENPAQSAPGQSVALMDIDSGTTQIKPLYPYYLHYASSAELDRYLKDPHTAKTLSSSQLASLKTRLSKLRKETLLTEGSLETLIEAYKKDKDPEIKKRIMFLLKQQQSKN